MDLDRARRSLEALSLGDAFGERFFVHPNEAEARIERRNAPLELGRWHYTDDTVMAIGVFSVLEECGHVDRDRLAAIFARNYERDVRRGYGALAHGILHGITEGVPWSAAARAAHDGEGSMGNGAAMRVAPIGACFCDDLERVVCEARASAEVTHAHPDGIAGAIAVAVAAAYVASTESPEGEALLDCALLHTPPGPTRDGLLAARAMSFERSARHAASVLGNGVKVIASDTVPFALWCAAKHVRDYEEAMWATVSGLGDRDTTCAIAGGVVGAWRSCVLPPAWLAVREPFATFLRT